MQYFSIADCRLPVQATISVLQDYGISMTDSTADFLKRGFWHLLERLSRLQVQQDLYYSLISLGLTSL